MPIEYGKYIYHFTSAETALLYILPSLQLKLSNYLHTNDPKESKTFGFWSILESCHDFKAAKIKKAFKSYLNRYCKLLCFSTDYQILRNKTDFYFSGFDHPTMWAHYGNNYKGVCIVLYKENFKSNNFQEENDLFDNVDYVNPLNFPSINQSHWEDRKDEYFKEYLKENAIHFFFSKHKHWQSEDELRLVHLGSKVFCSIENSIAGIYLGNEFDKSLIGVLGKMLPSNVWVHRMSINDGRLFPIPIDLSLKPVCTGS